MSLHLPRCRRCGQPILADARCCPHCAVPRPSRTPRRMAFAAVAAGLVVLALGQLALTPSPDAHTRTAPAPVAAASDPIPVMAPWPKGNRVGPAGLLACDHVEQVGDPRGSGPGCGRIPPGTAVNEVARGSYRGTALACLTSGDTGPCRWVRAPAP